MNQSSSTICLSTKKWFVFKIAIAILLTYFICNGVVRLGKVYKGSNTKRVSSRSGDLYSKWIEEKKTANLLRRRHKGMRNWKEWQRHTAKAQGRIETHKVRKPYQHPKEIELPGEIAKRITTHTPVAVTGINKGIKTTSQQRNQNWRPTIAFADGRGNTKYVPTARVSVTSNAAEMKKDGEQPSRNSTTNRYVGHLREHKTREGVAHIFNPSGTNMERLKTKIKMPNKTKEYTWNNGRPRKVFPGSQRLLNPRFGTRSNSQIAKPQNGVASRLNQNKLGGQKLTNPVQYQSKRRQENVNSAKYSEARKQEPNRGTSIKIKWPKLLYFVSPSDPENCDELFKTPEGLYHTTLSKAFNDSFHSYKLEARKWEAFSHTQGLIPPIKTNQILAYQELASQPFVKTVCELGFGNGYNALMWLSAKPDLQVRAFDSGKGKFTKAMARFLKIMFPRRLKMSYGKPDLTVPRWVRLGRQCDIISVDGGLEEEVLLSIMMSIRQAAAPTHILVTDNIFASEGKDKTWHDLISRNIVKERYWCRQLTPDNREVYNFAIGHYV